MFGILRANPKALITNYVREPKDLDLPVGEDKLESETIDQARSVVSVTHSEGGVLELESPVTVSDPDALIDGIRKAIQPFEYNLMMSASYDSGALTFSHKGQSTISVLTLDDDSEKATTRV